MTVLISHPVDTQARRILLTTVHCVQKVSKGCENKNAIFRLKKQYNLSIEIGKAWSKKLKNGKTAKNDRRNYRNWLILVLKDAWYYAKDCNNCLLIIKL